MQSVANLYEALLHLVRPPQIYHMDSGRDYNALIDALWAGEYAHGIGRFTAEPPPAAPHATRGAVHTGEAALPVPRRRRIAMLR